MAGVDWLYHRLRGDEFLAVDPVGAWKDRGRPGPFTPRGVLMHHTGFESSKSVPAPALHAVIHGRPELTGPLCHVLVGRDGICRIIAGGRANHAGDALASGPMPAGDGNTLYVGIEVDYAPQRAYFQGPSAKQYQASWQAAAAIVTRLGHGGGHVRYHRETSITGKWDPGRPENADSGPFPSPRHFRDKVAWWIDNYWSPRLSGRTTLVTPDDAP